MAAPLPPLVVTGASGFIGRRVIEALRAQRDDAGDVRQDVTLLVRDPASLVPLGPLPTGWRVLPADLTADTLPASAIGKGSVVVHLAAATGRLPGDVMRRVNVDGTGRLLAAARVAGAAHVIFVSSIAARFADRRWYHYAKAKRECERLVADSLLPYTIVRPTMVFGEGSPVQEGLERLALGGLPMVLGSGAVQLQPVHVDDVAGFLVALASNPPESGATVEVGGAERLSLRSLLARMRDASALPPRRPWSVPLAIPRRLLAVAERVVGTRLPVTAGQLASFVNDSDATPHPLVERVLPAPRALSEMFAPASPDRQSNSVVVASTAEQLQSEFGVLARYLGTADPPPRAAIAYARAHPSVLTASSDPFDRLLVSIATRSTTVCALADSYARVARPYGLLRRKLVLALAVLESTPGVHQAYDTARPSSAVSGWISLVALGTAWMLRTFVASLLFLPLHLAARAAGDSGSHG